MTNVARLCAVAVLAATSADARPLAAQDTLEYSLHGITIRDPARRMEESRSADVVAWARQQDSVTRAWLGRVRGADELRKRVLELATVASFSVPQYGTAGLFYLELDGRTDERRIRVRDRAGVESVLVLPHGDGRLANFAPAPRGPFMLHELHDEASGAVRLVLTRQHGDSASLVASHDGMRTSQAPWLPDGSAFVAARGDTVFRIDTTGARAVLLSVAGAATLTPRASEDGEWLVVTASSSGGAVVDVMPLRPGAAPVRITPATGEATEFVGVAGGRLLFRTDLAAPRGRVVAIDPHRPQPEYWSDVVAMQDSLTLRGAYAAGGRLLLHYLDGPRPFLVVQDGAARTRVDVPVGLIWTDYLPGWAPFSARGDRDVAYFRSINLSAPGIYAIDVRRAVVEPFRLRETGVDATSFESRVVFYTSRDGTRVPMFLIGRRDRPADPAPVLLQAYGAYGFTSIPFFNAKYVTFIERGGTFAIPFTRGDGVYGDAWHRAGRGAHKTNTVDDLIAAAEYLLAEGLAAPGSIAIEGQGPGGMVAGAAVLARPELWGAATLEAPVTDPIRTQLRSGRGSAEYGNIQDSSVVHAMQRYAPYYMVTDGATYPPILVRTGDQDRTIDPFHSYKLVERLQRAGSADVYLRVSWTEAHGFLRSAERRALDWADDLLFIEASLRR